MPWEYCTTFISTLDDGARTVCTEALPLSALPTSMLEEIEYYNGGGDSDYGEDSDHHGGEEHGGAVEMETMGSAGPGSGSGTGESAREGGSGFDAGLGEDQLIQVAGAVATATESLVGRILLAVVVAMLY